MPYLGPYIERIWPSLPAGAKIAILLLVGPVILKWGIDNWRRPHERRLGVILLVGGTAMVLAGIAALFSI
jgi:hypothetical protein